MVFGFGFPNTTFFCVQIRDLTDCHMLREFVRDSHKNEKESGLLAVISPRFPKSIDIA